ncbi:hypothetical protein [Flavobacterium succinicans]|uniref:DUF3575 domain-containing protein n=1 Tax=Flavobacterium succinicans TaxID=29536 RepID=A0A199XS94_9FLAO|nr:hypothetical protein [Flavobacterium succinicans]OAZ04515.1 hypothetical protein FLB_10890 [Flavobacterium succinicans]
MTKVITFLIIMFFQYMSGQHGLRFNTMEYFTLSTSVDPYASIKQSGLNIVGEIEYVGLIYAKAGFESHSALYGGYTDIHGGFGVNLTSGLYEKLRYYGGLRLAKVNRGNHGFRPIYGLEAGIDYTISDHFFFGLRGTLDKRLDQEIFGWKPELNGSGFIRIGYKWNYKKY